MPESKSPETNENSSAGHLAVRLDPTHADEIPFLFEQPAKRIGPAFVASLSWHVVVFIFIVLMVRYGGGASAADEKPIFQPPSSIIWLSQPGPGGGGGGGGNRMKEPPRQAELPGKDKITVPVEKAPKIEPPQQAKNEPNPVEQLVIPAKTLAAAQDILPGVIEAPPGPPTPSQGPGTGGGAGTGRGSGIGPGDGSGLGPGSGGGTGGGIYQPGSGVSDPKLLRQVRPNYTSDAMRAKVQGVAVVQCVVRTNGVPTDCQVYRSLDPVFGLDQEAVKAAQQWRFQPGTLRGEPVNVQVLIEMTFTLR